MKKYKIISIKILVKFKTAHATNLTITFYFSVPFINIKKNVFLIVSIPHVKSNQYFHVT